MTEIHCVKERARRGNTVFELGWDEKVCRDTVLCVFWSDLSLQKIDIILLSFNENIWYGSVCTGEERRVVPKLLEKGVDVGYAGSQAGKNVGSEYFFTEFCLLPSYQPFWLVVCLHSPSVAKQLLRGLLVFQSLGLVTKCLSGSTLRVAYTCLTHVVSLLDPFIPGKGLA